MFKHFFKSVKLILSNSTLLRRIAITFAILLVFKVGTFITIPLIDTTAITATIKGNNFLGFLNTFSGEGKVWIAPTQPMYEKMRYGLPTNNNSMNNPTPRQRG